MKKVFSILFSVVFLVSGLQITVAHHFCSERLTSVKISLTGELASCGMAQSDSPCSDFVLNVKSCCENQISSFGLDNKYIPEFFELNCPDHEGPGLFCHNNFSQFCQPEYQGLENFIFPPGEKFFPRLAPQDLCIFRI